MAPALELIDRERRAALHDDGVKADAFRHHFRHAIGMAACKRPVRRGPREVTRLRKSSRLAGHVCSPIRRTNSGAPFQTIPESPAEGCGGFRTSIRFGMPRETTALDT